MGEGSHTCRGGRLGRVALAKAERSPFQPVTSPSDGYCRFISVAAWLQIAAGQGQIFLPCEKIGFALGMSARTVSAYRQTAIRTGLLQLREKGQTRSIEQTSFTSTSPYSINEPGSNLVGNSQTSTRRAKNNMNVRKSRKCKTFMYSKSTRAAKTIKANKISKDW